MKKHPLMTRQHFEVIAEIIRLLPNLSTPQTVARTFARWLKLGNPRFNEAVFLAACNGDSTDLSVPLGKTVSRKGEF